ncbi:FliH/SctL family protein [Buchnera aphidicola]|uniref:FliH/SctL family protein n=1 Tax=Buchnera aphidicola TaxID=9 RepID=UPI003B02B1AD
MNYFLKDDVKKLKIFIKNFKDSFEISSKTISLKLLKISIKIAEFLVLDVIKTDKSIVLRKISKILETIKCSLFNFKIKIHPTNEVLVKKKFYFYFKKYNWKIIIDEKIDIYSCYIITEECEIDSTTSAIWNQIYCVSGLKKEK